MERATAGLGVIMPAPMSGLPDSPRPLRRNGSESVLHMVGAEVSEHRLKNGMRVIVAERHADPVTSSVLFYRVGSRNETAREAGMSHFLEHMMFKGSRGYGKGEIDRVTTELGGQNNAFTGYDHTAYWFEFASDRWEQALDMEADRMQLLLLDAEEFEAERAVVMEELAMGEDDPWRHLTRPIESALYPHHPYGRPIIGFMDTLVAMTPETMRDFYRRFYHPANATLVISGDVKLRRAVKAVRERFGDIAAGAPFEQADCFRSRVEEPRGEVRVSVRWDDAAHRLMMAWPTTPCGTDEDYASDLALTILTSGRMSRLYRRLVLEEGLATSVSAANDARVEAGVFWLYAEAAPILSLPGRRLAARGQAAEDRHHEQAGPGAAAAGLPLQPALRAAARGLRVLPRTGRPDASPRASRAWWQGRRGAGPAAGLARGLRRAGDADRDPQRAGLRRPIAGPRASRPDGAAGLGRRGPRLDLRRRRRWH